MLDLSLGGLEIVFSCSMPTCVFVAQMRSRPVHSGKPRPLSDPIPPPPTQPTSLAVHLRPQRSVTSPANPASYLPPSSVSDTIGTIVRERGRKREKQKDRGKQTDRERERGSERDRERERKRQAERERERETERKRDRQRKIQKDKVREGVTSIGLSPEQSVRF